MKFIITTYIKLCKYKYGTTAPRNYQLALQTSVVALLLLLGCQPAKKPELIALRKDLIALDQSISAGVSKLEGVRSHGRFLQALEQLEADYRLHHHLLNTNGFSQPGLQLVILSGQETRTAMARYLSSTGQWSEFTKHFHYLQSLTRDTQLVDAIELEERGIIVPATNFASFFSRTQTMAATPAP